LALVALGAVALGSYAIAPAVGGPSRLTVNRAKTLFYTKTQSNSRYYSKGASDARYLPKQSGETHITLDPWDWQVEAGAPTRTENGGYITFADNDNDNVVGLHEGSVLSQVVSKGLRLQAIEICWELDNGAIADRLEVLRSGPNNGDPVPDTQITFLDDTTDRTVSECHRFNAATTPVGVASVLDLKLTVDFPAPGEIRIGRSEAIFVP
jgi:hypothetical protein